MQILILAREKAVASTVQVALTRPGDRCTVVGTASEARSALQRNPFDLVIVDRDALDAAADQHAMPWNTLLQETAGCPCLLLIDAGQPEAQRIIDILNHGRLTIRASAADSRGYQIGDLFIDTRKKRVVLGKQQVTLSPLEYRLLVTLAAREGEVVPYRELLQTVWGYEAEEREARELLKSHIRQIRRRLGLDRTSDRYIQAVRGFGYMLADPADERYVH
jgi:DNA-binding response OmpR family regulator